MEFPGEDRAKVAGESGIERRAARVIAKSGEVIRRRQIRASPVTFERERDKERDRSAAAASPVRRGREGGEVGYGSSMYEFGSRQKGRPMNMCVEF